MSDPQQPPILQQPPTPQHPLTLQQTQPPHGAGAAPPKPQRNVLGIVALAVAVVGFIFAAVPGAFILGWILLPIAFILGLVALFLKGTVKWQGITAVIVAVVGTIVGFMVFFSVVATAVDDSLGGSDVEISDGGDSTAVEGATDPEAESEPEAEVGTRENPAAIGSTVEGGDWTVVVNSVTPDATTEVTEANMLNQAPDAGTVYMMINYTVTYTGDDPDGSIPAVVSLDYVTAGGVTVNGLDKFVVAPDPIDTLSTLYSGASATGNMAIQVPSPIDGVLAVSPGLLADKVFVALT